MNKYLLIQSGSLHFMLWSRLFKPLSLWKRHQWHCDQRDLDCLPKFHRYVCFCSSKMEQPSWVSRLLWSFPWVQTRCSRSCNPPLGPRSRCWPSGPMSCTPHCRCSKLEVQHSKGSCPSCRSSAVPWKASRLESLALNWGRLRGFGCRTKVASENPPVRSKDCSDIKVSPKDDNCEKHVCAVDDEDEDDDKVVDLSQRLLHLGLPHRAPSSLGAIPGSCLLSNSWPAFSKVWFFTKLSDECWQSPHLLQRHPWPPEIIIQTVYIHVSFS